MSTEFPPCACASWGHFRGPPGAGAPGREATGGAPAGGRGVRRRV